MMTDEQLTGLFAAIDTYSVRSWGSDSDRECIAAFVNQLLAAERAAVVEECARVCDGLADAQRETNTKHPMHALAYPQWRERITYYELCAAAIRKLGEKRE